MKEMRKCPYCGKEILAVAKKCRYCGRWLNEEKKMITCPVCGEDIEEGTEVCPYCNENISNATEQAHDAQEEQQMQPATQVAQQVQGVGNDAPEYVDEDDDEDNEPEGVLMYYYINVLFKHYIDFNGKLSRKRYWMAILINAIFSLVLLTIDFSLLKTTVPVLSTIYMLGTIVPSIAAGVRRLHDTGRSGWWYCVSLIPFIGAVGLIVLLCFPGNKSTSKPTASTLDKIVFGLIILSMLFFRRAYMDTYMYIYNLLSGQVNTEMFSGNDESTVYEDSVSALAVDTTSVSGEYETSEQEQQITRIKDFYTQYLEYIDSSTDGMDYLFSEYLSYELLRRGAAWDVGNERAYDVPDYPNLTDYFRDGGQTPAAFWGREPLYPDSELMDVIPVDYNTFRVLYIDCGERAQVLVKLTWEDGNYKIAEAFS